MNRSEEFQILVRSYFPDIKFYRFVGQYTSCISCIIMLEKFDCHCDYDYLQYIYSNHNEDDCSLSINGILIKSRDFTKLTNKLAILKHIGCEGVK